MKNTTARRIASLSVAVSILAPAAGIATAGAAVAAPAPMVASQTQSLTPHQVALYNAGYVQEGPSYQTNRVDFSKVNGGKTFVGDDLDGVYTRTWIPWTGEVVLVAPESHTVTTSTPASGATYVKGAILSKFLGQGGEQVFGRAVANERTARAGDHAGALLMATQSFQTGTGATTDFYWTSNYGAHPVKGAIRGLFNASGGANMNGVPKTDERTVTVNGKVYQEQTFERTTIRWSSSTGAFFVR